MGGVQVTGLADLVKELKGPAFKQVNKELRAGAKRIAQDLVPAVQQAVAASGAPQAAAMARTVRPHSDRVPVVVVGKVNPRFKSGFKGGDTRRRRGAMALGVVSGPAGGHRSTRKHENYYRVPRSPNWGHLGAQIRGPIMRDGEIAYLELYVKVLKAHGFKARA